MATNNEHMNEDERWLRVLAGEADAADADTRQAEALRNYFTKRSAEELEAPADPERTKRMLNYLEARGAFHSSPASAQADAGPKVGWLTGFRNWLFPVGGGHPGRFALVATIAVAVLAVPVLRGIVTVPDDDTVGYKAAPGSAKAATILAASPEQDARQVADLLARHGVKADIRADGDDRILTASIPPAVREAVRQALAQQGIPGPADGQFELRIRPFK